MTTVYTNTNNMYSFIAWVPWPRMHGYRLVVGRKCLYVANCTHPMMTVYTNTNDMYSFIAWVQWTRMHGYRLVVGRKCLYVANCTHPMMTVYTNTNDMYSLIFRACVNLCVCVCCVVCGVCHTIHYVDNISILCQEDDGDARWDRFNEEKILQDINPPEHPVLQFSPTKGKVRKHNNTIECKTRISTTVITVNSTIITVNNTIITVRTPSSLLEHHHHC